jgi:Asp-tRNA(Asn)/Glu-tRNA(Gln) amidotransferase A subunit family amidase
MAQRTPRAEDARKTDDLVGQDAAGLAQLIAARQVTVPEVVQAHLERIEGSAVNAFVTVLGEQAMRAAADPRPGPLSGVPFHLAGLPAVAQPFGTTASGLPVGVQFVGRHWSDRALLDLAERLESVSPVRGRRP